MSLRRLAKAITDVGQSPCDKYSCRVRKYCADKQLACDAFLTYVVHGYAKPPLWNFNKSKDAGQDVYDDIARPTRASYIAAMRSE